jgi:Uncharacterized protein conserved in bacteria (DUF2325)
MSQGLRVAFVGGVFRVEREIYAIAAELGVDVEIHDGHVRGHAKARLAALVRRSDVLFVVMGTNSHAAVNVVRTEAARSTVDVRLLKSCGSGTARSVLTALVRDRSAA